LSTSVGHADQQGWNPTHGEFDPMPIPTPAYSRQMGDFVWSDENDDENVGPASKPSALLT